MRLSISDTLADEIFSLPKNPLATPVDVPLDFEFIVDDDDDPVPPIFDEDKLLEEDGTVRSRLDD